MTYRGSGSKAWHTPFLYQKKISNIVAPDMVAFRHDEHIFFLAFANDSGKDWEIKKERIRQ